jgi:cellulose synthase/poly-beta-1,6-N-acetylglucosamine synthase-like glycosyltransferase
LFFIILLVLSASYAIALLIITYGYTRLPNPSNQTLLTASIVVAIRNEEENLPNLLYSLAQLDYPADHWEAILVDDGSSDRSRCIIEQFIRENTHLSFRLLKSQGRDFVASPKKHALSQGIAASQFEIILLTDADCTPSPHWIKGMVSYFERDIGMVIGFSPYETPAIKSLGHAFQALDAIALAALTAGTTGWQKPATCNGRNLAYRKSLFQSVGGFSKIKHFVSGDDDLFLKIVQQYTDTKIAYAYSPFLAVPTRFLNSKKHFFQQRIRHASKGFAYNPGKIIVLAGAYVYNCMILLSLPIALSQKWILFWVPFGIKSGFELALLLIFAYRMKRHKTLWFFPLAEIMHIPYVVIFGALGPLLKVQWKKGD